MNIDTSIFKAYDIRGVYPTQINGELVYKIAQAYAHFLKPKTVVVGRDMRLSGQEFRDQIIKALTDAGVNVIDIGLVSTDQLYFAAATLEVDGGIQITASHNPKEYAGMKMVREKGMPISGDSGIYEIRDMVNSGKPQGGPFGLESEKKGTVQTKEIYEDYYTYVLKHFDFKNFKPLTVVANTNFGMANPTVEYLQKVLPVKFLKIVNNTIDGSFPKGRPDPLVSENRGEIIEAIKELKPDLGVAWDADADRCFFFDSEGKFVTPAYINALLSKYYIEKFSGGKVIHDTRVVRVIQEAVKLAGGEAVMNKAGHSFIKERMIKERAVFGSETSGHYYFQENFYLDNGLFPFLAVLDIMSKENKTFSEILKPLRDKFQISEEINFKVNNLNILEELKEKYKDATIDATDGYSFEYPLWRFNVRKSNTENLLRINLEADSEKLLAEKTLEVSNLIEELG